MVQDFLKELEEAELVLVGLGEEFDTMRLLKAQEGYSQGRTCLEEKELHWLLPVFDEWYRKQTSCGEDASSVNEKLQRALGKLEKLLQNKNYFVITTALNDAIADIPWKDKRMVAPCGGSRRKQCPMRCVSGLQLVSKEEAQAMEQWIADFHEKIAAAKDELGADAWKDLALPDLGCCPKCGKPLVLNSIYAENYDENGYMEQWSNYTKWLQGTLNRKVLILELGVGMKFPSVIRWPFEKAAFFNQKASFYRVNETLYQLTEEIKEKGTSIPKNSVDWLISLC